MAKANHEYLRRDLALVGLMTSFSKSTRMIRQIFSKLKKLKIVSVICHL